MKWGELKSLEVLDGGGHEGPILANRIVGFYRKLEGSHALYHCSFS